MTALIFVFGLLAAGGLSIGFVPGRASDEPPATTTTVVVEGRYRGHTAAELAAVIRLRTKQLHRSQRRLVQVIRFQPSVREALDLACTVYRTSCARVFWIAVCEAGHPGVLPSPTAKNPTSTASGLGQFIDSTWASTPFARFSVFSTYANALAIAWEVARGGSYVHWKASSACWAGRS